MRPGSGESVRRVDIWTACGGFLSFDFLDARFWITPELENVRGTSASLECLRVPLSREGVSLSNCSLSDFMAVKVLDG